MQNYLLSACQEVQTLSRERCSTTYFLDLPGSLKHQPREVQNYLFLGLSGSLKPQPREVQKSLLPGSARKSKTSAERGAELLIVWACQATSNPSRERCRTAYYQGLPGSPNPQPREVQNYLLPVPARESKTSAERGAELLIVWACQEV